MWPPRPESCEEGLLPGMADPQRPLSAQTLWQQKEICRPTLEAGGQRWCVRDDDSDFGIWRPRFDLPATSLCQKSLESLGINEAGIAWKRLSGADSLGNSSENLHSIHPAINLCDCEEGRQAATAFCQTCRENLCNECVKAHQRVSLTRSHQIIDFKYLLPITASSSTTPVTDEGSGEPSPLMSSDLPPNNHQLYSETVDRTKADCEKLLTNVMLRSRQVEDAKGMVLAMKNRVDTRYHKALESIDQYVANIECEVMGRKAILVHRLTDLTEIKQKVLGDQIEELNKASQDLREASENLTSAISSSEMVELAKYCCRANSLMLDLQQSFGTLSVKEDDFISLDTPFPTQLFRNFACVSGSSFAKNSFVEGDGVKKAVVGKDARFTVHVYDQLNEPRLTGGDPVVVQIMDPNQRPVISCIQDTHNGIYSVIWKPVKEGLHTIFVTIKDSHIRGSPFKAAARFGRDYTSIREPVLVFGIEGTMDGELCRPWGVCCSQEGEIMIANRSNNRIEVFNNRGMFLRKFGSKGNGNGQFDRPSSLCCNSLNRVIIADKDNHRIQILSTTGEFIKAFGEKGSKPGQFHYPWDVACNSRDDIVVSDTRNHRIQVFTSEGVVLFKYGHDSPSGKQLDSPRGVTFMNDKTVLVTDFNTHRLIVIDLNSVNGRIFGTERNLFGNGIEACGSANGQFTRPNGVTIDPEGYVVVADSRNDRVQIFTAEGVFITKFGTKGSEPGQFDRPSGLCISPDGRIIVVDFGNNRVQIF